MKVVKVVIGTVLFAGVALVGLKFYTCGRPVKSVGNKRRGIRQDEKTR